MDEFVVRYIDEDELPEGQAWVIGITSSGTRFIFMKRGAAICPTAWENVWLYGHVLNAPSLRVAV